MAGERFAVRNSGVKAVVEGIGDHGCEYMTGGIITVLGEVGKNFAAGMSGGVAYIWNPKKDFQQKHNPEMVDLDPMEASDFEAVRMMVRKHFQYTGSAVALEILNTWHESKQHFTKVMPRDYKAALLRQKEKASKATKGQTAGSSIS